VNLFRVHIIIPELPKHSREQITREEAPNPQAAFSRAIKRFTVKRGKPISSWVVMIERVIREDEKPA
jgi:hypothetical protein